MGMRYHYLRLCENGWLQADRSLTDKRARAIIPTDKLLSQFSILNEELSEALKHWSIDTDQDALAETGHVLISQ